MPPLAFSPVDVLVGLGLAAAGFVVVALVCVAVLAALQAILPSTDSGAAEIDRLNAAEPEESFDGETAGVDTELNA